MNRVIKNIATTVSHKFFVKFLAVLMLFSMVALPTSFASKVSADSDCDPSFYESNTILFYNPCASQCTDPATEVTTVDKLDGANNGEKIYKFWVDAGLSSQQSASITSALYEDSGFSAFRKNGDNWGVAGFNNNMPSNPSDTSNKTGDLDSLIAYLEQNIGKSIVEQYHNDSFGGPVFEDDGFVPKVDGMTVAVNDAFLLAELNYLLAYIKVYIPSNSFPDRVNEFNSSAESPFPEGKSLYDYIKTASKAEDVVSAWTYLYDHPSDKSLDSVVTKRLDFSKTVTQKFNKGSSFACGGGLIPGGMNLEQAKEFMEIYKTIENGDPNGDLKYITAPGCHALTDNCVVFSQYFVNKYTTLKFGMNNGGKVASTTLAANGDAGLQSGTEPQPYALFSIKDGVSECPEGSGVKCGHTGIILGVDIDNGKVIVGQASWCKPSDTEAVALPISTFSSGAYTYAYLSPFLKGDAQSDIDKITDKNSGSNTTPKTQPKGNVKVN